MSSRFDFEKIADTYDQWYETAKGLMYDRLERKAIRKFLPQDCRGLRLLEVGCGTGHWCQFFSQCGFQVVGLDISERMISKALEKNLQNTSFYIADCHLLPFTNNSFDITAAITTLEFVCNPDMVLREMVRCTRKPGGKIFVGALNSSARVNQHRQGNSQNLYTAARMFTIAQLERILARYGQVKITTAGFIPETTKLLPLSPLFDRIGHFTNAALGAFIVAEVTL